ncbi:hypothetical protein C8F04DRAFT_1204892 [Mycena alexandri]|uniref:Uncharacterized protein n=1 Tax=Mycena alexandri TaxID=1745969 RepID=A0AAD6RVB2_9AGAR|nr:hypothetical protein C8F04DRAFT_1204892 [Mycena alexandri]
MAWDSNPRPCGLKWVRTPGLAPGFRTRWLCSAERSKCLSRSDSEPQRAGGERGVPDAAEPRMRRPRPRRGRAGAKREPIGERAMQTGWSLSLRSSDCHYCAMARGPPLSRRSPEGNSVIDGLMLVAMWSWSSLKVLRAAAESAE